MTTLVNLVLAAAAWIVPTTVFLIAFARLDASPVPDPETPEQATELNGWQGLSLLGAGIFCLTSIVGSIILLVLLSYDSTYDRDLFAAEGVAIEGSVVETELRRSAGNGRTTFEHFRIEYQVGDQAYERWFKETRSVPGESVRRGDTIELVVLPGDPGNDAVLKAELDDRLGRRWRSRNVTVAAIVMGISGSVALFAAWRGAAVQEAVAATEAV